MDSWDAQKMLDKYVYDYLVKKGHHMTAEILAAEANVVDPTNVAIKSPEGLLYEWWDVFYNVFRSRQAERAQESHAETSRTIDNVVPQVPYVVPASSPHAARPVHNISPVVPTFTPQDDVMPDFRFLEMVHPNPMMPFVTDASFPMEQIQNMPLQWEARVDNISPAMPTFRPSTLVDEVMVDLRFLEMDPPSQRVPFLNDSSRPLEQIPNMPQQWEARNEGEGPDIYFGQNMQVEPNADAPKTAMLPLPDPSEAGQAVPSAPALGCSKFPDQIKISRINSEY